MPDDIILKTVKFVQNKLAHEGSGHDWLHIERVWKMARFIALKEQADLPVVELAALLHDIADWKFHDGDDEIGPRTARHWLETLSVDATIIERVYDIIKNISFKGAKVTIPMASLEGKITQDADRLDAIGAIGIARTFTYGGYKGRPLYDFTIKPELHTSAEAYKKNQSNTFNHFYEKLLLLKDLMHTETAKKIAERRHRVMEKFLSEFIDEINFSEN